MDTKDENIIEQPLEEKAPSKVNQHFWKSKPFLSILLLIILIVIIVGLFLLNRYYVNKTFTQNKADVNSIYNPAYQNQPTLTITPTLGSEIIPIGYSLPCEECNFTKNEYISDYPVDTSTWMAYTIPTENLKFKFPPDWKINTTSTQSAGKLNQDIELFSPNNFVVHIAAYEDAGLGGGCGGRICRDFNISNIVLGRLDFLTTPLYIVVNGNKLNSAHEPFTRFNVITRNDCFVNICNGFKGKNISLIMVYGGYLGKKTYLQYTDPEQFSSSPDMKTAVGILKTLIY